jgi:hypothetical protein
LFKTMGLPWFYTGHAHHVLQHRHLLLEPAARPRHVSGRIHCFARAQKGQEVMMLCTRQAKVNFMLCRADQHTRFAYDEQRAHAYNYSCNHTSTAVRSCARHCASDQTLGRMRTHLHMPSTCVHVLE